ELPASARVLPERGTVGAGELAATARVLCRGFCRATRQPTHGIENMPWLSRYHASAYRYPRTSAPARMTPVAASYSTIVGSVGLLQSPPISSLWPRALS